MNLLRNRTRRFLIRCAFLCSAFLCLPSLALLPRIAAAQPAATADSTRSCGIHRVTSLPGSHQYASDFLEALATDPTPAARDSGILWGLTADLDSSVPASRRAIYLSRSGDGGNTWRPVARLDSRYFDAKISEGLRNGLAVSPGGKDFIITTQEGAFQVIPRTVADPLVRRLAGPRVPRVRPPVVIPKKTGDPVRAGVVQITADGKRLIVAYGYFDLNPQLFTYVRDRRGRWVLQGRLARMPTRLDIFSMQLDPPASPHPGSLYVGTGDQAYRFDFHTRRWTLIQGVGPDSAIHSISTAGGLHLAACWGVYEPVDRDTVARVTHASFLLHPNKDQSGPNIRAYGIQVDPAQPDREILTAITGVYITVDRGKTWRRIHGLPEGEFHTAHFNPDGTILVSGQMGTFVANPFSPACHPQLRLRGK